MIENKVILSLTPKYVKLAHYKGKTVSRDRGLKSVAYDIACSFLARCPQSTSAITIDLIEGTATPQNKEVEVLSQRYCQMLCDQIEQRLLPVNIVHQATLNYHSPENICTVTLTDCRGRQHQAISSGTPSRCSQ